MPAIDRLFFTPAPVNEKAISAAADSSNHLKELDDFTDRLNTRFNQSSTGSEYKLKLSENHKQNNYNSTHGSPRNHQTKQSIQDQKKLTSRMQKLEKCN